MEKDSTIIEKFSDRILKFFNKNIVSDYLLEQILSEFELEIINETKLKDKPPKSRFMEEWGKALICEGSPHDSILLLAKLIDKHKADK